METFVGIASRICARVMGLFRTYVREMFELKECRYIHGLNNWIIQ